MAALIDSETSAQRLGNFYRPGSLRHLKALALDIGGIFPEHKIIKLYAVELPSVHRLRQLSLDCLGHI